jgi:lysozyme
LALLFTEAKRLQDSRAHREIGSFYRRKIRVVEYTQAEEIALNLLKRFEGFRAYPYPDPVSGCEPWTIGYGSTRDLQGRLVTADTPPITEIQASQLARLDMVTAFNAVASEIKAPLTAHERAAVEDFIYNVGAGNFRDSTLLRLINQNQLALAAKQFEQWDHADGRVISGLLRRRLAEEQVFLTRDA